MAAATFLDLQVSGATGVNTRLFFPGLLAATWESAGTVPAEYSYTYKGVIYQLLFSADDVEYLPGKRDVGGTNVTDITLSRYHSDNQTYENLAEMTITPANPNSQIDVGSFAELTPDSMVRQAQRFSDILFAMVGDAGNDRLYGSDYNDFLKGAGGNDILSGYDGKDTFFFDLIGKDNADHVADFQHLEDTVKLDSNYMPALNASKLDRQFHDITKGGMNGEDSNDRLLYDRHTGTLYYDDDGSKANGDKPEVIAIFDNHVHLDIRDFEIF